MWWLYRFAEDLSEDERWKYTSRESNNHNLDVVLYSVLQAQ
jgi:hypothetical protein